MLKLNVNLIRGNAIDYAQTLSSNKSIEIGNSLGHDLFIRKGKLMTKPNYSIVNGLGPCLQFMLLAPRKAFNSHSAPELENIANAGKAIVDMAVKMRDDISNKTGEILAFITGGMAHDSSVPITAKSNELLNNVFEALEDEGIETTVIAAQYGDGIKNRMNTFLRQHSIDLSGGPINDIEKVDINASQDEIKEILENHFEFVELSPNVKINFFDNFKERGMQFIDR